MAIAAQGLAEQLGLTNRYVFFNEGWVDYDDRQNFLLEATLGVTAHFDSAETRFAFGHAPSITSGPGYQSFRPKVTPSLNWSGTRALAWRSQHRTQWRLRTRCTSY